MTTAWVLRKGERVYVFQKRSLGGAVQIEILDYDSMEEYHQDVWRERRSGNTPAYARGVWDKLVESGFTRWEPNSQFTGNKEAS